MMGTCTKPTVLVIDLDHTHDVIRWDIRLKHITDESDSFSFN